VVGVGVTVGDFDKRGLREREERALEDCVPRRGLAEALKDDV